MTTPELLPADLAEAHAMTASPTSSPGPTWPQPRSEPWPENTLNSLMHKAAGW